MPVVRVEVDLSSPVPVQVIPTGNVALSLVVTSVTIGAVFEVRCGTSGDWIGPFVGVGDWPLTIALGDGLPASDLNRGVFVRAPTPTPGARLVLNASFGDKPAQDAGGGVSALR